MVGRSAGVVYQATGHDRNNQLDATRRWLYYYHNETQNSTGNASMYTLMTQEHSASKPEYREIESVSFAHKMGENGGFYKVQLIDENGVIVSEWKA